MRRLWASILASLVPAVLLAVTGPSAPAGAEDVTAKLVYVYVEKDRLVASNVRFNRIDELRLQAGEDIERRLSGDAVVLVITDQRYIAYSVFTGAWRTLRRRASERVVEADAADASASVRTSDRFLVFSGRNGVWAEQRR